MSWRSCDPPPDGLQTLEAMLGCVLLHAAAVKSQKSGAHHQMRRSAAAFLTTEAAPVRSYYITSHLPASEALRELQSSRFLELFLLFLYFLLQPWVLLQPGRQALLLHTSNTNAGVELSVFLSFPQSPAVLRALCCCTYRSLCS